MTDSDSIWIEFLSSLYDDSYTKEDNEEEEEVNDPEYRISEDLRQIYDEWDFRNDKSVKVSDHELDLLFEEEDNDIELETIETAIVANNQTIDSNVFDNKEMVIILVKQIEEHIQLLTQTYLQSINNNSLESVAQNAKSMLIEMSDNSNSKTNSIFSTINLKPAINLINNYPTERVTKTTNSLTSWRSLPVTQENQIIFKSNPNVFLYKWLLPYCGYYDIRSNVKNKSKTVFTLAEDHLIALGLEQFTPLFSLRKCYRYIKQLLLPIKTVDQIRTHIKNLKRRSNANDFSDNPIMYYSVNNRAPETHSGIIDPKLDTYLLFKNTPEWYKKTIKFKQNLEKEITERSFESNNALSNSQIKAKKSKSLIGFQNDKKKSFISQQSSPVKQTNSIVKKYRYLNRINPLKQTHSVITNTNSRSNKCLTNPTVTSSVAKTIDLSDEDSKVNSISSETICPISDDNYNVNPHEENQTEISDKNNEMNSTEEVNMDEDDCEKPLNEIILNEDDVEFDDESDLAALMTASSTITIKNRIKSKNNNKMENSSQLSLSHSKKEGRKSLAVKQRESTLQMLSLEWNEIDPNAEHKEELLVKYYLEKVRKSLTHENFVRFLTLLSEFNRKRNNESKGLCSIKELYCQIEQFLNQLNVSKDIISEFVLFLSAEQAEECGKMFDYLYWKRFFNFVRKLEIYSSVDPQCLQRLFRSLNQLKQNEENLDKNKIRSTVSRVLNGHLYLMHEFSSLFLDEKPSQCLFEDEDLDEIAIESSDEEEKNDSLDKICFENINIPENDDELKYGTNECPCKTCHFQNNNCQSMGRHCTSCSIRFIGGRLYLTQNHKKLSLAQIHYHQNHSHLNKLLINHQNKQIECEEEVNVESDHDMDIDSIQLSDKSVENNTEKRKWTKSEDKMLLELCRSKVIEEKRNDLSEEVFEEVALKLSKDTNEVIARFNQLMELFASEHQTIRETEELEI